MLHKPQTMEKAKIIASNNERSFDEKGVSRHHESLTSC
jgi:hypothetical protein